MIRVGIIDPSDKSDWVEVLKTGNYIPFKTKMGAPPGMRHVRLRRKKGTNVVKPPRSFYLELREEDADEFIEQIKRDAGDKGLESLM